MQFKPSEYNEEIHDKFKALTVRQPYANRISIGAKLIELRTRNTSYRGDIVICASSLPEIDGLESGCTICIVELYDTKEVSEMTDDEKRSTCLSLQDPYWGKAKYGWMLRNPRPLIEYPVSGQLGLWNLIYSKDVLIQYPEYAELKKKKISTIN